MAKNQLWLGYLEAGSKSSAVLHDPALDTGSSKTLYLYNLARDAILEYRREIVEAKLRELRAEESALAESLTQGYAEAQRGYRGLRLKPSEMPEASPLAATEAEDEEDEEAGDEESLDEEVEDDTLTEDVEVGGSETVDGAWDEEES